MDDPDSDEYIVKDISPARDFRRWAFAAPELRFLVKETHHLKFAAEIAIPQDTFKVTGPVTIICAIDGKKLAPSRCDHAGDFRLEKPVPDGWVAEGKQVHVTFEASPRWISPLDGAQLSFLLRGAGFIQ
jgi:hypothetical protein